MKNHPHMPNVYLHHPVTVSHERGPNLLIGTDGTAYVDFLGQDGCTFLHMYGGDTKAGVAERNALFNALQDNFCTTNFLDHRAKGEWADKICELTGYDRALPLCSGSEANDAAMKLAVKRHWLDTGAMGYIVAMPGYYGRTVGANSASGANVKYVEGVGGWDRIVTPADRDGFRRSVLALADDGLLAGIITETLPGRDLRNGWLDDRFVEWLGDMRNNYDFAIIVDEIKTGGGRMGRFLSSEAWNPLAKPDIVTMSKSLAAGLPFGAVLAREAMWDGIDYTWHTSTMGGNPALCAYSTHLLSKVTRDTLEATRDLGFALAAILHAKGFSVVGAGLHQNILIDNAFRVRDRLIEHGFLVYCIHDDFIAIYPNMYTTEKQVTDFVDALESCV